MPNFYPNKSYLEGNLKPESYDLRSLVAMANALRIIEPNGFSKDLSPYVLPNMLIENRPDDYGLRYWEFNADPKVKNMADSVGIVPTKPKKYLGGSYGFGIDSFKDESKQAWYTNKALGALLKLQEKRNQVSTPEEAVQRWNGSGQGAENHLSKVKIMLKLLRDPANKDVVDTFNNAKSGSIEYP